MKYKSPSWYIFFAGSDVNRQDVDGRTPLMLACAHDDGGKCVEYLLSHKADPSIVDNKVRLNNVRMPKY